MITCAGIQKKAYAPGRGGGDSSASRPTRSRVPQVVVGRPDVGRPRRSEHLCIAFEAQRPGGFHLLQKRGSPEAIGGATTKNLFDDFNPTKLAQVMDGTVSGAVTRTYAKGLQRISDNQLVNGIWTPTLYGYDGHGSVRSLTNSSGSGTDTYTFDAFGNQIGGTGTTPNKYLFSGEQFDNRTNLYQLPARWYQSTIGRFITTDPVERFARLHIQRRFERDLPVCQISYEVIQG